ncbi:unnamed protein product [Lymnaea stagnalis]|uniref:Uncharacterized protein n=1 Tax=Lymnaea stagnalis TaxID=6523 RepID=A0AAV2HVJ4_LYMST
MMSKFIGVVCTASLCTFVKVVCSTAFTASICWRAKMSTRSSVPILRVALLLLVASVACQGEQEDSGVRFVFPFYPRELDILIGHLQSKLYKVKTTLDTCKEINDGNHKAGSYVVNIYDNGNASVAPRGRVSKLETIAKLREDIESAESELEKCRFQFWTGDNS